MRRPEHVAAAICMLLVGAVLAVLVALVYRDLTTDTYNLPKDEWRCTASHVTQDLHLQQVGKVSVPIYTTSTVCDRFERH